MFGNEADSETDPGILPLLLEALLSAASEKETEQDYVSIEASCFEVYNEQLFDLFDETNELNPFTMLAESQGKNVRQDRSGLPCRLHISSLHDQGPMEAIRRAAELRQTTKGSFKTRFVET